VATRSAAVSHVGRIRSNNQDSGYAGSHLFLVADGMGGHAGGDVASAVTAKRVAEIDATFSSPQDAEFALQSALIAANQLLAETVYEHPELTGMGTTVSALVQVRDRMAIAHIGDSRIYLLRDGELSQVTSDHTFVQRLVDSGRITPEEAAVHPRRSVLMRVLGDVDAAPEIDTLVVPNRPGDRWLICSDGLSSYVDEERIAAVLGDGGTTRETADRLIRESLDAGAPDNVTVVLIDVDDKLDDAPPDARLVGSAASPLSFEPAPARRGLRLPTLLLHPLKSAQEDAHFEPESDEYFAELIAEDRRRHRRRRIVWLVLIVLAGLAVAAAALLAYQWTQTHYYVGADDRGEVAIFRGVQQGLGPIPLSSVYEESGVAVDALPDFTRESVEATISADDLADARDIVARLEAAADG